MEPDCSGKEVCRRKTNNAKSRHQSWFKQLFDKANEHTDDDENGNDNAEKGNSIFDI